MVVKPTLATIKCSMCLYCHSTADEVRRVFLVVLGKVLGFLPTIYMFLKIMFF